MQHMHGYYIIFQMVAVAAAATVYIVGETIICCLQMS